MESKYKDGNECSDVLISFREKYKGEIGVESIEAINNAVGHILSFVGYENY